MKKNPQFELVSVQHGEATLHGLRAVPENPLAVLLHVHGTWGNFYANPFIVPLAEVCLAHSIAFLSVNVPGHDETAVDERFEASESAIGLWASECGLAAELPVLLQGHSLGALKHLRMLMHPNGLRRKVKGLILLSPFDIVAFYAGGDLAKLSALRVQIQHILDEEGPGALVPKSIFDLWPISSRAFLELSQPNGVADVFPSRDPQALIRNLEVIKAPMLICLGATDFAAFPSAPAVARTIEERQLCNVSVVTIDGGPHNFAGVTQGLSLEVNRWLSSLV